MPLFTSQETPIFYDHERVNSEPMEWFAIQVKCRYEEHISSILIDKGYEALSATSKVALRPKKSGYAESRALFPGYIFARFDVQRRIPILVTPGVQAVVGYGKVPVPVDAEEISAIRQVLESGNTVEPCPFLTVGDQVRVIAGPLRGMQGILVQQKAKYRVVLSVSLIQRSIKVEVPIADLALTCNSTITEALNGPNSTITTCAR